MSDLRPVRRDYEPGYPRQLTEAEIQELLRPSLFRRFSSETLLAGALLAGATASGCSSAAAPIGHTPPGKLPNHGTSTRTDRQLKEKVDRLTAEILGKTKRGSWNETTTIWLDRELKSNPPLKYPSIPICYGNSRIGIFDQEAAREATRKLFALYGIELRKDMAVNGDGYEFVADGWNDQHKIGFKLTQHRREDQAGPASKALDPRECAALDRDVEAGKVRIFVADAGLFPNMDGDLYTPMEYYLASVVDYLNWVHGDQAIELNSVLGKLPGGLRNRSWRDNRPVLPGCDFEAADDLKHWKFTKGAGERSPHWSGFGRHSLMLRLQPGGEAVYTVPRGETVLISQQAGSFGCKLFYHGPADDEIEVAISLLGEAGQTWDITKKIKRDSQGYIVEGINGPRMKEIKGLKITAKCKEPIALAIDDIGVHRAAQKDE